MIEGCCLGFGVFFPFLFFFAPNTELPPKAGKLTPKLKAAMAVKLLTLKSIWSQPFLQTHPLSYSHFPMFHLYIIYKYLCHALSFLCLIPKLRTLPVSKPKASCEPLCPCQAHSTQIPQHIIITQDVPKFNSSHPRIPNPSSSTPNKSICIIITCSDSTSDFCSCQNFS